MTPCPNCQCPPEEQFMASTLETGDLVVCVRCDTVLLLEDDVNFRAVSEEEFATLPHEVRAMLNDIRSRAQES